MPISFAITKLDNTPIFMKAKFVEYNEQANFIYARDDVQILSQEQTLNADNLFYDIEKDILWLEGNVVVVNKKDNSSFAGESIILRDHLKRGVVTEFAFRFKENALLAGKLVDRIDPNLMDFYYSSFTPCTIECDRNPIWEISAEKTTLDLEKEEIRSRNMLFKVYGFPVFYSPYFVHPVPGAKAKSGILIPTFSDNSITVPLYYRAAPNMDTTITPRISSQYTILDGEFRHKPTNGYYQINASYGRVPYSITKNGTLIKKVKLNSYHLFTLGDFSSSTERDIKYNYGFDIKRTSDKAYLKNYYSMHDSYMTSKVYLDNVDKENYFSSEGLHFLDLKAENVKDSEPFVLPRIRTKNVFHIEDLDDTFITLDSNNIIYNEASGLQLVRSAIGISATNKIITDNGQLFTFRAKNRTDLYVLKNEQHETIEDKVLVRQIPEISSSWRYPFVSYIASSSSVMVEPIVSGTIGKPFKNTGSKFNRIDPEYYELSENNIFNNNRYSGIDSQEFGTRISYGIKSAILQSNRYLSVFLGRLHHKHNGHLNNNGENVGKVSFGFNDNSEILYRFRKNKKLKPIRDEFSLNLYDDKLSFSTNFINIHNVQKYYPGLKPLISKDHNTQQLSYILSYQLTPNWLIGNNMHFDLSHNRALSESITVTYSKDCVSITGGISNDYTSDSSRGIKKSTNYTIRLGLKAFNL